MSPTLAAGWPKVFNCRQLWWLGPGGAQRPYHRVVGVILFLLAPHLLQAALERRARLGAPRAMQPMHRDTGCAEPKANQRARPGEARIANPMRAAYTKEMCCGKPRANACHDAAASDTPMEPRFMATWGPLHG